MRRIYKLFAYGISLTVVLGFLTLQLKANAQELNLPQFSEQPFEGLENTIPGPIRNFVDSVRQVGVDITYKAVSGFNSTNFDASNPLGWFSELYTKADSWFFDTTGVHLRDAFRGILNIVVGVLSFILKILRWLLSLVQ